VQSRVSQDEAVQVRDRTGAVLILEDRTFSSSIRVYTTAVPTRGMPSNQSIAKVGERIAESIGHGHVDDLRIHPNSKKYLIPSATHPYLQYVVHLTSSDKRNSCTCDAHKRRLTRPCKHVIALKRVMGL
jgi:hypothetical protein